MRIRGESHDRQVVEHVCEKQLYCSEVMTRTAERFLLGLSVVPRSLTTFCVRVKVDEATHGSANLNPRHSVVTGQRPCRTVGWSLPLSCDNCDVGCRNPKPQILTKPVNLESLNYKYSLNPQTRPEARAGRGCQHPQAWKRVATPSSPYRPCSPKPKA